VESTSKTGLEVGLLLPIVLDGGARLTTGEGRS
jgi:hypothetical protein